MMKAKLISMGSVYLTGILEEPLQSYLSGRLTELGIEVLSRVIIADEPSGLDKDLAAAFEGTDLIVLTGCGLAAYAAVKHEMIKGLTDSSDAGAACSEMHFEIPGAKSNAEAHILQNGRKTLIYLSGTVDEVKELFEDEAVGFLLKENAEGKATVILELTDSFADEYEDIKAALNQKLASVTHSDNPSVRIVINDRAVSIYIHAVGPGKKDAGFLAHMMAGDCSRRIGNEYIKSIRDLEEE